MIVLFLHGSNYNKLKEYYDNQTVIPQGSDFYAIGDKGSPGGIHFHVEVFKGEVEPLKPSYDDSIWAARGNIYPYDVLFVNKN